MGKTIQESIKSNSLTAGEFADELGVSIARLRQILAICKQKKIPLNETRDGIAKLYGTQKVAHIKNLFEQGVFGKPRNKKTETKISQVFTARKHAAASFEVLIYDAKEAELILKKFKNEESEVVKFLRDYLLEQIGPLKNKLHELQLKRELEDKEIQERRRREDSELLGLQLGSD